MMSSNCASLSWRMAENPLARISPWLRCEPKMWSSGPSGKAIPTAAASCPMERWAGPVREDDAARVVDAHLFFDHDRGRHDEFARCVAERVNAEDLTVTCTGQHLDQSRAAFVLDEKPSGYGHRRHGLLVVDTFGLE